jgi:hypothetical protein
MISIIISSANQEQLAQVSSYIAETIGVPYEIIATGNSDGGLSISEIYNRGIDQAKYDMLCFMHEDIIIESKGWGSILKKTFDEHPEIGLLGVFGSDYKSITPMSWHGLEPRNIFAHIIQSYKHSTKEPLYFTNPPNSTLEYVACVDGLWLATKREVVKEFRFDESTFKGFHCYDLDYCLTVGQKYKVGVVYGISLNHLSEGSYSGEWMEDNLKLHEKWKDVLPVNINNYSMEECARMEKRIFTHFIDMLMQLKLPAGIAYKVLKHPKYKEFGLYWKLRFYTFKRYWKKR